MKKNLVMGVAKSYSWDILEPFVNSCKKNCPSADIIFFVDDISDFTRARLINHGVFLFDIPAEYRNTMIINLRWKLYLDFLEEYGNNYAQIFTTDTRDVIFQSDVFEQFKNRSNFLVYATEADDIRGSKTGVKTNYNWCLSCLGNEETYKLLDKKIICCGTIIGTTRELKIFCSLMWDALKNSTIWGHEQAVMNYLIRNDLLPIANLIESDVESGAIFTTALADNFSVRGDKIYRNGSIPAVVHQYDRKESLTRPVDEIYHDKNFQFDERFSDTRSIIEQAALLLFHDNINSATRIFLRKYLSNTDFRNFGGALIRLWSVALNKPLSQPLELLELAAQNAATSAKRFGGYVIATICDYLKRAKKIGHPVDPEFKNHIANILLENAVFNLDAKNFVMCFICFELIEQLDMPPDKDFYLFVAKACRLAGKKNEALAAYKKVLELS